MESPTSRSVVMTSSRMPSMPTWGGKYFALAVLFVMNTLNYVDRYAFFAVGSHIQRELQIDDYWFGWLASAFMIVYTAVVAVHGMAGRPLQSQTPHLRRRRFVEFGDGRGRFFGRFLLTCSSGGLCWGSARRVTV